MFMHNKRLMYTVRVAEPNPVLEQPSARAVRRAARRAGGGDALFQPGAAESDPGRKDMLLDIATEELSHLEVIGSIVACSTRA